MLTHLFLALSPACSNPAPTVATAEDADGDHYSVDEDCDDNDPSAHPGGTEVCDGVDNDCDGEVDEDVQTIQYTDADGDNYGDPDAPVPTCGELTVGLVANADDCDDTNPMVNPDGSEASVVCDDLDNDCDGMVDGGLRVPADWLLPSDAVGAARDGETVCIAPGTYTDTIDFGGDDVIVLGTGGADVTILDGGGVASVVSFDTRETSAAVLKGFTITGGSDAYGAGIYLRGASPTLEDLVITGNRCNNTNGSCYGGGVYAEDSDFTMRNVRISENTIQSSYSYYPYNYGAGMALIRSSPTLEDVEVRDNQVTAPANASYGYAIGLGVYVGASSAPDVDGLVVAGNHAASTAYYYSYGGGLYFDYYAAGTWDHVVIADNVMETYVAAGGGVCVREYSGAPRFTNVVIANNFAGGLDTYSAAGGGIYTSYAGPTFTNVDIVGNWAIGATGVGGGVYLYYYAYPTFNNVSIWGNDADGSSVTGGDAIANDLYYPASTVTLTYSSASGNGDDPYRGYTFPVGTNGNIEGDPMYTSVSGESGLDWDLTLGRGSALRDVGDPRLEDADGSACDIGSRGGPGGEW
jgi:hypothetical protein